MSPIAVSRAIQVKATDILCTKKQSVVEVSRRAFVSPCGRSGPAGLSTALQVEYIGLHTMMLIG